MALIVFALIATLSFLSQEPGTLTRALLRGLRQGFGWGAFVVPLAVGAVGVWLIWRHFGEQLPPVDPVRIIGGVILFLGTLTLLHAGASVYIEQISPIFGPVWVNPALSDPAYPGYTLTLVWDEAIVCPTEPQTLVDQGWVQQQGAWDTFDIARCGHGGGLIGAAIQGLLQNSIGSMGAFVIALAAIFGGSLMATRKSLKDVMEAVRAYIEKIREQRSEAKEKATAYRRTEDGKLVPIEEDKKDKEEKAPEAADKKEDKKPPEPLPGRPSIVTGRGPAGSPSRPPSAAPTTSPPEKKPVPEAGAKSPASTPRPSGPPPARPGIPSPSQPGAPARPTPSPGLPGQSTAPGSTAPARPGTPGATATTAAATSAAAAVAKPGQPTSDDSESEPDKGVDKPPGGGTGGREQSRPGNDTAAEGKPSAETRTPAVTAPSNPAAGSSSLLARRDASEPGERRVSPPPARPTAPPGSGSTRPGSERSFGPTPPSSLGGARPVPKPSSPPKSGRELPTRNAEFDDLENEEDPLEDAIDLDDMMPPTDEIIKKLVDDNGKPVEKENPGTPLSTARRTDRSGPPGTVPGASPGQPPASPPVEKPTAPPAPGAGAPPVSRIVPPAAAAKPEEKQAEVKPPAASKPEAEAPVKSKSAAPPKVEDTGGKAPGKPDWKLPKIDVLKGAVRKGITEEELRQRAEIIEMTLSSFGAPARVVEVNHGPVITQFGVEPDYIDGRAGKRIKVKVGKISALADDLALSLAAPTIRIEAPVPGKGFVGVEVPNAEPSIVGLRDVMDTPVFDDLKSPLKLALGQNVSGEPICADMTAMPHLLIAGTTGSGKSVCVNGIICTLLMTCTPDELQMIMVDPKRVELTNYNGIPHLMSPVVTELERIVGVLKWVQREMDDRYRKFAMAGARNITDYNGRIGKKQIDGDPLPYILVIVDELADLMMLAPDETERVITRLAQMARATGIHIIISTQRPSVDVVTGLIKANFPSRIAFAVATGVDSRVILDMPGAEKLLGRGDMLFQAPDTPMPVRLQGVYVSDEEIDRIVQYWRDQAAKHPSFKRQKTLDDKPSPGGSSVSSTVSIQSTSTGNGDDDEDGDDMFDEAVELVRSMDKASISLLQRHLRIGYTRAARLIDLMEEHGVIGPHEGGSKPREVLES
ncbi:MAG: hypothetical protein JXJ17_15500 [Anaerolineae bacterium]|nr:hypothetical protein [Anaerolineae bacterium]